MPYTILYVEDETAIIELVHLALQHPKILFKSAYSGVEGLEMARSDKPEIIMLDVMMPDRDGWLIYKEIRGDEALHNTPIIMLTGQMHKYRIKKEFEKSAIDAYITKPFDILSIRTTIEKMLNSPLWSKPPAAPIRSRKKPAKKPL